MTGLIVVVGVVGVLVLGGVGLGALTLALVGAAGKRSRAERHEWWVERCGGRAVVHGGPEDVSAGLQRAAAREYPKAVSP